MPSSRFDQAMPDIVKPFDQDYTSGWPGPALISLHGQTEFFSGNSARVTENSA